jgi:hypothetical protein
VGKRTRSSAKATPHARITPDDLSVATSRSGDGLHAWPGDERDRIFPRCALASTRRSTPGSRT